uniref:Uncharacterized protein n=1 Tax=Bicosoecida sp. CB-2014 TaxID=1486930 RepID=A0A7S1CMB2_9STRA|mmetsp:Transcript_6173/g.21927  ORF Transcript_6173/g.21927 Transcript_6173/m.21927 type:complete len:162 (+) Transcript_6173:581-1066(+)
MLHRELHARRVDPGRAWRRGVTVVSFRLSARGEVRGARPCVRCSQRLAKDPLVRHVVWSAGEGEARLLTRASALVRVVAVDRDAVALRVAAGDLCSVPGATRSSGDRGGALEIAAAAAAASAAAGPPSPTGSGGGGGGSGNGSKRTSRRQRKTRRGRRGRR